tara:strand:+ start:252 stop:650 length:399 start_codon:yes stop_codon:yes gene_type:complete
MDKERYNKGLQIRKEVLGEKYVNNAINNATDFNRGFQELTTEYCWGAVWGSDGLSRKQRSILNLGILATQNRSKEFSLHFRAALKNGCSLEELRDVLEQITIYCGVPTGLESFRLAKEIINEIDDKKKKENS